MSIKLGKPKNWGSRSGKTRARKQSIESSLADLSIPTDLLESIVSGDASVKQAAESLLSVRKRMQAGAGAPKSVYSTSRGKLFQGDCIKVLSSIDDNSIDCIFADPPFNLSKDYGATSKSDDLAHEEYLEWTRAWLELCCAKLKPGGALFVYNIPKWSTYIASFLNSRLTFRNWIAIDLTFSMPIPSKLYPAHYSLLYYIKGDRPNRFSPPRLAMETCKRCGQEQHDYGGYKMKMNPEGISLRDVWVDIPPVRHSKYKNRDANELSLKLLDRVLDIATEEGDLIFDPFGGSGTTYIAAELRNCRWIGAELGNCGPIIDRLKNIETDRLNLRRYQDNQNKLFTDKALRLRCASGLPLDNYQINEEQLKRVIGPDQLKLSIPHVGARKRSSLKKKGQKDLR